MAEEYDFLFKSIVVGDGGVGKTALTLRFSKGFFTEDYKMTIGVDFHVKTITIETDEGPIRAKLQIWDTGGQERFSSIRPMYYRGSLGALLIFDLTNSDSFEHLPQWIEEVRANVKTEIPLLLVGNKSDLIDQRAVTLEEINEFTRNFNLYYMETSAKTGEGVGDCFYILACLMIGSGVPDQLISQNIVFSPGLIKMTNSEVTTPTTSQINANYEYAAPPVPEPQIEKITKPTFALESDYDFEAPPVPEPTSTFEPTYEPEIPLPEPEIPLPEPEIPLPEPSADTQIEEKAELQFKTPEQILAEESSEEDHIPSFILSPKSQKLSTDTYKPKTVPFTSNVPVPAPPPAEFKISHETELAENIEKTTPFLVDNKPSESKPESLTDYMPEPIYSKKDKKKMEKQKKKEEKERKLQEEKERQQKLIQEMKKVKKEKKEKPKKEKKEKEQISVPIPSKSIPPSTESSSKTSLFQTLSQKAEDTTTPLTSSFVPFSATKESEIEETSTLRIIPNVEDVETKPAAFTPIQSSKPIQEQPTTGKEMIVCKKCGAILSADYAFCNKCGTKL